MSTSSEHAARKRANELYWQTDAPVRSIAEKVGMSRSAVYAAIEPLSTDVRSPHGEENLVFTTRTNRETGVATCPHTGTEHEIEPLIAAQSRRASAGTAKAEAGGLRRPRGADLVHDRITTGGDPEKALFGLLLILIGAVFGFAAGRWVFPAD